MEADIIVHAKLNMIGAALSPVEVKACFQKATQMLNVVLASWKTGKHAMMDFR